MKWISTFRFHTHLSVYSTGKLIRAVCDINDSMVSLQAGAVTFCKTGFQSGLRGITGRSDRSPMHRTPSLWSSVMQDIESSSIHCSSIKQVLSLRHGNKRAAEQVSVREEAALNGTTEVPHPQSIMVIDSCDLLLHVHLGCFSRYPVLFANANVMGEGDCGCLAARFMSAEAPAYRRAVLAPSGCQQHRASWRNPVPPLDSYWADKCQDLERRRREEKWQSKRTGNMTVMDHHRVLINNTQTYWTVGFCSVSLAELCSL